MVVKFGLFVLWEEHGLKVFETSVLRLFELKKVIIGGWRKLQNACLDVY